MHPELNLVTKSNILNLYAYVDADHGRDIDTRRSVTAYVFYLGVVLLYAGSPNFSNVSLLQVCSLSIWLYVQRRCSLYGLSLLFVRLDIVN